MTIDVDGSVLGKKWIVGNTARTTVFFILIFLTTRITPVDYSIQWLQWLSQKVRFVSSTANEGVRLTSCKLFTFRHEVHQEHSEPFSTQQLVLRK